MTRNELIEIIRAKRSYLTIGLDTDIQRIPEFLKGFDDPVYQFNKAIIDATHDLAISYKINLAFYEALGAKGWQAMMKTVHYLRSLPDKLFLIADAKRGDIFSTAEQYARAFLADPPDGAGFDAITVSPYMGLDSMLPFFGYSGKWAILLVLTSNLGSADFQLLTLKSGEKLFERVIKTSLKLGTPENLMFVVGATYPEMLRHIRAMVPEHFLLIPGIGAQGGSLTEVSAAALTQDGGILVNVSRSVIYASRSDQFAEAARNEALKIQQTMAELLKNYLL